MFDIWVSDVGKYLILRYGENPPEKTPQTSHINWRHLLTSKDPAICELIANAYKFGYVEGFKVGARFDV